MSIKEKWKAVKGYKGLYEVSNLGRVRSLDRISKVGIRKGRILKPGENHGGYLMVSLSKKGVQKTILVHRLVATAFVSNPDSKETVNHINEDKHDNRACNLEWLTLLENLAYGTRFERAIETMGVPVYQIELNGFAVIERHKTLSDAARTVGAEPGEIWGATKHGGTCRGFYWRRTDSITKYDLLFWRDTGEQVFGENIHEKENIRPENKI